MDPVSQSIIGQIVHPRPTGTAPEAPDASTPMTIAQIIHPAGTYTGPERRTQGVLVAEVAAPAKVPNPAK